MIITESKPYGMIKAQLKKEDKIGIIACNGCARMCGTGGKEGMERLAEKLKADGFNVVETTLLGAVCDMDQLKRNQSNNDIDVYIVLACEAGLHNVRSYFSNKKVLSGTDTIGLGAWDEKGDIIIVRKFK